MRYAGERESTASRGGQSPHCREITRMVGEAWSEEVLPATSMEYMYP